MLHCTMTVYCLQIQRKHHENKNKVVLYTSFYKYLSATERIAFIFFQINIKTLAKLLRTLNSKLTSNLSLKSNLKRKTNKYFFFRSKSQLLLHFYKYGLTNNGIEPNSSGCWLHVIVLQILLKRSQEFSRNLRTYGVLMDVELSRVMGPVLVKLSRVMLSVFSPTSRFDGFF